MKPHVHGNPYKIIPRRSSRRLKGIDRQWFRKMRRAARVLKFNLNQMQDDKVYEAWKIVNRSSPSEVEMEEVMLMHYR